MSTRLTDEQVAELATCDAYIHPDDLMALAAEVQRSRQRRCGNCLSWGGPNEDWSGCDRGLPSPGRHWSCGYFTVKESK
jgi:hypothetical protein